MVGRCAPAAPPLLFHHDDVAFVNSQSKKLSERGIQHIVGLLTRTFGQESVRALSDPESEDVIRLLHDAEPFGRVRDARDLLDNPYEEA